MFPGVAGSQRLELAKRPCNALALAPVSSGQLVKMGKRRGRISGATQRGNCLTCVVSSNHRNKGYLSLSTCTGAGGRPAQDYNEASRVTPGSPDPGTCSQARIGPRVQEPGPPLLRNSPSLREPRLSGVAHAQRGPGGAASDHNSRHPAEAAASWRARPGPAQRWLPPARPPRPPVSRRRRWRKPTTTSSSCC